MKFIFLALLALLRSDVNKLSADRVTGWSNKSSSGISFEPCWSPAIEMYTDPKPETPMRFPADAYFKTLLPSAAAISASASFWSRNFCATALAAAFLTAVT